MLLLARAWKLVWLIFLTVFGTTKLLENVEDDWDFIIGVPKGTSRLEPSEEKAIEKRQE